MRQLDGLSTIKAGAVSEKAKASFRIRWRAEGTYTTADRLVHNGVTYEIKSLAPDRIGRAHIDLVCQEV
jgi:SPP1 family predicted phage head-tail adaptor